MQIRYFESSWNDIKNSPGWFGKLCLLGLINFIPIFGQIVTMGYLYGWAREMAWGVHEPLPERIFGNEDGKLYRRGFFILVVGIVLSLIPVVIMLVGTAMQSYSLYALSYSYSSPSGLAMVGSGTIITLLGSLLSLVVTVFAWVGYMRASIYDRISAGLQLGKMWKMIRQDMSGILRVFGMYLLVGIVIGLILSIVISIVLVVLMLAGIAGFGGMYRAGDEAAVLSLFAMGGIGIILMIALCYVASVSQMFVEMLAARAMGYWTMQFDVPHWRGQDDPMPFELQPVAQPQPEQPHYAPAAGAQPTQGQPYGQAYGQPQAYQQAPMGYQAQPAAQAPAYRQPAATAAPVAAPVAAVGAGIAAAAAAAQASDAPETAAAVSAPAPEGTVEPFASAFDRADAAAEAIDDSAEATFGNAPFIKRSASLRDDPDYKPIVVGLDFFAEPEEEFDPVTGEVRSVFADEDEAWEVEVRDSFAEAAAEAAAAVEETVDEAVDAAAEVVEATQKAADEAAGTMAENVEDVAEAADSAANEVAETVEEAEEAIAEAADGAANAAAESAESLIAPPGVPASAFDEGANDKVDVPTK